MIVKNAKYEVTAVKPEQYPNSNLPEIAFVGRSNVGKSSIINALSNRKNLARVGSTPGKTKQINFFNIDEKLYFVDLPGYGYASVSKGQISAWGTLAETYFNTRDQLNLIIIMVDIRHKPSEDDMLMYQWIIENNFPHIVVASKADKVTRSQIKLRLQDISKVLGTPDGVKLIPFSSVSKQGINEIWEAIDSYFENQQAES